MHNNFKKAYSSNRPWFGKWWVWLLAGIVALGIFPLIINFIFKTNASKDLFVAEWSAGEALIFYGTIFGSVSTIIAVVATIIFTNNQNRKSEKFQRHMTIANNRKIFLDEKYENIYRKAETIKNVILLDALEDKGFQEMLMNKAFTSYPQKLIECYKNIEFFASSRNISSDIEKKFLQNSMNIIELIGSEYERLSERLDIAEAEMKIFKTQKSEPKIKIKAILNRDELFKKTEEFDEDELKSKDICQEFKDILNENKKKYQSDFEKLYNQYVDYLKQEQLSLIDELYKFGDK